MIIKNKVLETLQALQLTICAIAFISLLFFNYKRWEITVLLFAPLALCFIFEFFKDESIEAAYEKYVEEDEE